MDCAMSIVGIVHFKGRKCGTVDLSIHFLAPLRFGAFAVDCHATRRTRGMVYAEAGILDARGRLVARGIGIVSRADESDKEREQGGREDGIWHSPDGLLR